MRLKERNENGGIFWCCSRAPRALWKNCLGSAIPVNPEYVWRGVLPIISGLWIFLTPDWMNTWIFFNIADEYAYIDFFIKKFEELFCLETSLDLHGSKNREIIEIEGIYRLKLKKSQITLKSRKINSSNLSFLFRLYFQILKMV